MPKRKTIGKDPFAADVAAEFGLVAPLPTNAEDLRPANDTRLPGDEGRDTNEAADSPLDERSTGRAVGGRLEILGGDLGTGDCVVWRFGPDDRVAFVSPAGRMVDLAKDLDAVQAWPDRTDRRVMSAIGWASVMASVAGIVGAIAGGGIRLLIPRRMIVKLRLIDGSKLVARTDGVTAAGLRAFVRM